MNGNGDDWRPWCRPRLAVSAVMHVRETDLAWSLIEAAKRGLDERERNHVFICVGAGDAFTAIRIMVKLIALKRIPLESELVQLCATWLEAYALHEDHPQLQLLIHDIARPANSGLLELPLSAAVAKPPVALTISAVADQRGRYRPNRRCTAYSDRRIAQTG